MGILFSYLFHSVFIGVPASAVMPKVDPGVRIKPGGCSPDDLSMMIYRTLVETAEDRSVFYCPSPPSIR